MKVPMKWLRDYVAIDIPAQEFAYRMTMAGLEAEQIEQLGADWDKVFVGEVMSVTPHPDADRLVLADVDAGEHRLTVVTGAPNIAQGQKVALALAGARLIDAYADTLTYKTLKPGKIRGVMSEGMVCSEKELGISDEHEGILVLEDDAPKGAPLKDVLGDTVIEFEITPNLVHAFSMIGIAREAGAVLDAPVTLPTVDDLATGRDVDDLVAIDAPDLCSRYTAIVVDGARVEPSPEWLASRLTAAGVRPVNNLVDVTNYVMLEYGQPLHAFDLRDVPTGRIVVRRAEDGESLETLDHIKRTLTHDDLLITDGTRAIGLAGVMGGLNSEIKDDTTSLLLESATFDMVAVRNTARRLKLRTDASARFERGLDPNLAWDANLRAVSLILALCPGASVRVHQDVYPHAPTGRSVSLPVDRIDHLLGMAVPDKQILAILGRLGFDPEIIHGELTVTVPSWRTDVSIPVDVIEEVARIVGYDALPATLPIGGTPPVERDPMFLFTREIDRSLAASGSYECRSYISADQADIAMWTAEAPMAVHAGVDQAVRLKNPINAEQPYLRTSIVPALVRSVADNLKHERTVRLFETGHIFVRTANGQLPKEPVACALAWAGHREPFDRFGAGDAKTDAIDFFDVKGVIEQGLGAQDIAFAKSTHPALHPGRAAEISYRGERIGVIGELRPDVARRAGIEDVRVVVAELNLSEIFALRPADTIRSFTVDHFLPVEQDFAFVVERATPSADVQAAIVRSAGPLLTGISLFDVFSGTQTGEDQKSLAYRLTFTAPDRALTDAELGKVRKKIEGGVRKLVGGELRT